MNSMVRSAVSRLRVWRLVINMAAMMAISALAAAQVPLQVLHEFSGHSTAPGLSSALIQATDGNFYGTTASRPKRGSIFKMTPAGAVTILHSFVGGPDGGQPAGALLQASDGNFYGMTTYGGSVPGCDFCGHGTVFRMTPGGVVTILHLFTGSPGGAWPSGALIQGADGSFYGTTTRGGSFDKGTVFRMTSDGTIIILHSFAGAPSDGAHPLTLLQSAGGTFYGVTGGGGGEGLCANGLCARGTVFSMTADGAVTILHAFEGNDGSGPNSVIQAPDGNFYGTTGQGGVGSRFDCGFCGFGTIFRMTPGGSVTVLHAFTGLADGEWPGGVLQSSDGNFYGTARYSSPNGLGTLFRMTSSGVFTVLHTFAGGPDGASPLGGLVQARDGTLYGTTEQGGGFEFGTVFTVSLAGTVSILTRFPGGAEGARPGPLVEASDGHFYGTTYWGGAFNHGTIFRMTRDGATTVVYTFAAGLDGGYPVGALVQASDGNLYGTTARRGAFDRGIAFRFALDGTFTILHWFSGAPDGQFPSSGLTEGADGYLYSTTSEGGVFDRGTVFRMSLAGSVAVVHHFVGGTVDGAFPATQLLRAADGNLYGTTLWGGISGDYLFSQGAGTVFRLSPGGAYNILHRFDIDNEGAFPNTGLVQGLDGSLFGTTSCGTRRGGAFFRIGRDGLFTILSSNRFFCDDDLPNPYIPLARGRDGTIYGTGSGYGNSFGVFSMTPSGTITRLVERQATALLHARDGNLYATSEFAGAYNAGEIFRLDLHVPPFAPTVSVVRPTTNPAGVTLRWSEGWGVTSYTIRRRSSGGGEIVLARGLTTTSFTDTSTTAGVVYTYVVTALNAYGESVRSNAIGVPPGLASRTPTITTVGDYDGDGRTDVAVYRGSTGEWFERRSSNGGLVRVGWGSPLLGDRPVPADYDGDGEADVAVYRQTTGEWFIHGSLDGRTRWHEWGAPTLGDVPVPADYDGDGEADLGVYRGTTGEWFIRRSSDETASQLAWGAPTLGDVPVPADYDRDGRVDVAVYRGTTGEWFILRSSNLTVLHTTWGAPALSDVPVPADYDGDGAADVAVYRGLTGEWFLAYSSGGMALLGWGAPALGDVPVPGDYDDDGRADVAVYRELTGEWFIRRWPDGGLTHFGWGSPALGDTVREY